MDRGSQIESFHKHSIMTFLLLSGTSLKGKKIIQAMYTQDTACELNGLERVA